MKRIIFLMLGWGLCLIVQAQTTNFSKLNFGCDGSSTTSGNQWSKTVVDLLGFASHHNVAVGSSTFACHPDTQDYNSDNFAGISDGWKPTKDKKELQMRHNNVSKVHIQKFISEVKDGVYPAPDVFVFAMGSNDTKLDGVAEALSARTLDDVNVTTMAGGARWAIQTILENFPECRVFVWLPIQTGDKAKMKCIGNEMKCCAKSVKLYPFRLLIATAKAVLVSFRKFQHPWALSKGWSTSGYRRATIDRTLHC